MHTKIPNMTDSQLLKFLTFIYPSKKINRTIIHELHIRDIKNNLSILKYLLHLKKMKFDPWSVNRLLLILFDVTHNSNKFIENNLEILPLKTKFKVKKVIKSIKNKNMSSDFENFIKLLENIILVLNKGNDQNKHEILLKMSDFFINLIEVYEKIKFKIINFPKSALHVYFKETWLYIIRDRKIFNQILFLILINSENYNDMKIKIINSSLKKILFNQKHEQDYKELYYIVHDMETRYENYTKNKKLDFNNNLIQSRKFYVPIKNMEEKIEEIEFKVDAASKTKDEKCLEWYHMRKKGLE